MSYEEASVLALKKRRIIGECATDLPCPACYDSWVETRLVCRSLSGLLARGRGRGSKLATKRKRGRETKREKDWEQERARYS